MINIDTQLDSGDLQPLIERMWELSATKILAIEAAYPADAGTPVITVDGQYQPQGWTEWTQGFQFGSALLQFDATGDEQFLELGRHQTLTRMQSHVSHIGVHDHGFNNVSTYGSLLRLLNEGRTNDAAHRDAYRLALQVSGAVQASRWSTTYDGQGYIYSFNGPHSLFCDTIRSLRSLAMAHQLDHALMGENDERISLLDRLIQHARTTAAFNVYYGTGRDHYDVRGRVAHESVFNRNDGRYRCPSTQQGYSPFTTWTRGLAWIMSGYAELLEYLATRGDEELDAFGGRQQLEDEFAAAAGAACDYYIGSSPSDGVPYWDTGAPGLSQIVQHDTRPSNPFNDHEPIDSSAAAIGAQGLLRFGNWLGRESAEGQRYWQAGLTVLRSLLSLPYISDDDGHQGLLLHTIYHRPRGWDHVPADSRIPAGESCMWGDYHLREVALYLQRINQGEPMYYFFGPNAAGNTADSEGAA